MSRANLTSDVEKPGFSAGLRAGPGGTNRPSLPAWLFGPEPIKENMRICQNGNYAAEQELRAKSTRLLNTPIIGMIAEMLPSSMIDMLAGLSR